MEISIPHATRAIYEFIQSCRAIDEDIIDIADMQLQTTWAIEDDVTRAGIILEVTTRAKCEGFICIM